MQLIFATNNDHKVKEIRTAVGNKLEIVSLREAGIDIEIPEPWDTLEGNATEKSSTIHRNYSRRVPSGLCRTTTGQETSASSKI